MLIVMELVKRVLLYRSFSRSTNEFKTLEKQQNIILFSTEPAITKSLKHNFSTKKDKESSNKTEEKQIHFSWNIR